MEARGRCCDVDGRQKAVLIRLFLNWCRMTTVWLSLLFIWHCIYSYVLSGHCWAAVPPSNLSSVFFFCFTHSFSFHSCHLGNDLQRLFTSFSFHKNLALSTLFRFFITSCSTLFFYVCMFLDFLNFLRSVVKFTLELIILTIIKAWSLDLDRPGFLLKLFCFSSCLNTKFT